MTRLSTFGRGLLVPVVVAALAVGALLSAGRASGGMYTTRGHQLLDPAGQTYLAHGFNRPSLEWNPSGELLSADDVALMRRWGANIVRIPTNQDFLLPDACTYDPSYLATLDQLVGWVNAAGMNALIDLHWSDRGQRCLTPPGQQEMADDRSLQFWRIVAAHYRGNPRVFLDLYNEPHDISWDCWLDGCATDEGWRAVGMQQLYDTVRAAGFRNLVFVGGLDWARDLSGVPAHPVRGYSIVYATHPYVPEVSPAVLRQDFGALTGTYPVVATEFGPFAGKTPFCSPSIMQGLIGYFDAPDGVAADRIGWLAWAWYAADDVCTFPAVIGGWDGTPAPNGVPVQAALARYKGR